MAKIVKENNLKVRSYSFYESLFERFHWVKPIAHRCFNKEYDSHPLREPSPQDKGNAEKCNYLNQKQLEQVLRDRDERLKVRTNKVSS